MINKLNNELSARFDEWLKACSETPWSDQTNEDKDLTQSLGASLLFEQPIDENTWIELRYEGHPVVEWRGEQVRSNAPVSFTFHSNNKEQWAAAPNVLRSLIEGWEGIKVEVRTVTRKTSEWTQVHSASSQHATEGDETNE